VALGAPRRAVVASTIQRALFVLFHENDARLMQRVSGGMADSAELNAEEHG
jgi:hypothetical protein